MSNRPIKREENRLCSLKMASMGSESARLAGESEGRRRLQEVCFLQLEAAVLTADRAPRPSTGLAGQKPLGSCEPQTPAQDP